MSGPLLKTARLELWRPVAEDLADFHALTMDDTARRYLGQAKPDLHESLARLHRHAGSWTVHGYGAFMVRLTDSSRIVGTCGIFRNWQNRPGRGFPPEAGWIIHRSYWRRGLAAEAMRAALCWFDSVHGRKRVDCVIEEGNVSSEGLAKALGFIRYASDRDEDGGASLNLFRRVPGR